MVILAALAAVAAVPQPSTPLAQPKSSNCPAATNYFARAHGPLKPQKLTELPDANAYLTVYRRIDGCEVPIVVKYRVSGR